MSWAVCQLTRLQLHILPVASEVSRFTNNLCTAVTRCQRQVQQVVRAVVVFGYKCCDPRGVTNQLAKVGFLQLSRFEHQNTRVIAHDAALIGIGDDDHAHLAVGLTVKVGTKHVELLTILRFADDHDFR
ncbi:hypothetical protein D3C80_1227010 [compost metagenome]